MSPNGKAMSLGKQDRTRCHYTGNKIVNESFKMEVLMELKLQPAYRPSQRSLIQLESWS